MDPLIEIKNCILNNDINQAYIRIMKCENAYFSNGDYWNIRGVFNFTIKEFSEAISCFEKSLLINPYNSDAFYNYAFTLEKIGRGKEAAHYYGFAFKYAQSNELREELLKKYKNNNFEKEFLEVTNDKHTNHFEYPKVSIIIPTYNQKVFLKESLESALNQDYPNLEVIVGDDNSNDGTDELLKNYLDYPNLKYIKREKNLGAGNNSRDILYNHCLSKYVMMLNHDDYLTDMGYISQAVAFLKSNPNLSFVWANCYIKEEENQTIVETNYDLEPITKGTEYFIKYETGNYKHITGFLTTVFDREKAIAMNCFKEETKSKDLFVYLKLMLVGDVGFIKEKVSVYRIHKNSISFNMPIEYDYTTIGELEKLKNIAFNKGFKKDMLENWFMYRMTSYFSWRIGTLKSTGKIDLAKKLYNDVIASYPSLESYFNVFSVEI